MLANIGRDNNIATPGKLRPEVLVDTLSPIKGIELERHKSVAAMPMNSDNGRQRPFRIDRCLEQLRAAGKLDDLAGIGMGALVECSDPRYPEADACEVFLEAVRPLGIPVVTELPFGHVNDNRIWPVGARAEIDGETGEVVVLERGVSGR